MADSTDYRKWVERAKQDLKILEVIYSEGLDGMEDSFCYICHQAAEKLLKAFIVKYTKTVSQTHDLIFLLGKCRNYKDSLSKLLNSLTVLNEYSVAARYPSDSGQLKMPRKHTVVYPKLIKNCPFYYMINCPTLSQYCKSL